MFRVCSIEIHIFADINNFFHGTVQDMQGMDLNNFGSDSIDIVDSVRKQLFTTVNGQCGRIGALTIQFFFRNLENINSFKLIVSQ